MNIDISNAQAISVPTHSEDRGIWTPSEDSLLTLYIEKVGIKKWRKIHQAITSAYPLFNKSSKQCRERWYNYLNPVIQKSEWTTNEIDLVFQGYQKHGSKWSFIGKKLKGRTDNAIKNLFYCRMRKMVRRIAKERIEEEMYLSVSEFKHSLYVLECIKTQYVLPLQKSLVIPGDQYIVNLMRKCGIGMPSYSTYLEKLFLAVPECIKNGVEMNMDSPTNSTTGGDILPPFESCEVVLGKRVWCIESEAKSLLYFGPYMKKVCPIVIVQ
jgi:hypothetical protein